MTRSPERSAPIGYFWGDDAFMIDRAATELAKRVAGPGGESAAPWRTSGAVTSAALIAERVATGAMFGGGTIAIVADPLPLIRSKAARDELLAIIPTIAPGNALALLDAMDRPLKTLDSARAALATAIADAGGDVRSFVAPKEGGMARWIDDRARERGIRLGRGAAPELARRIGAFVREGDVDRRRQGQLAVGELDKLALYRLNNEVSIDDVRALVSEAIPGSAWQLLDAVAARNVATAARSLELVLDSTPEPVVVVQLHRRLRELIQVADLLSRGTRPSELPRLLKLHPFRAETLARQAAAWTIGELEDALEALLELDAAIKGAAGRQLGEPARRLAFTRWLAEHVVAG